MRNMVEGAQGVILCHVNVDINGNIYKFPSMSIITVECNNQSINDSVLKP